MDIHTRFRSPDLVFSDALLDELESLAADESFLDGQIDDLDLPDDIELIEEEDDTPTLEM